MISISYDSKQYNYSTPVPPYVKITHHTLCFPRFLMYIILFLLFKKKTDCIPPPPLTSIGTLRIARNVPVWPALHRSLVLNVHQRLERPLLQHSDMHACLQPCGGSESAYSLVRDHYIWNTQFDYWELNKMLAEQCETDSLLKSSYFLII